MNGKSDLPREVDIEGKEALSPKKFDADINEDQVLALLKHGNLSSSEIEKLGKDKTMLKSRKLRIAIVEHPKTPRHILLPIIRHLYTFDLMRVALQPAVATDVKLVAEESLMGRLEKLSAGEKLTLARRASGRVASALLRDSDLRILETALQNSRLTEALLIKEMTRRGVGTILIDAVSRHPKWRVRHEVRELLSKKDEPGMPDGVEISPQPAVHDVSEND